MPTPDRTTLRAAVEALTGHLRTSLTAEPPTAARPLRLVVGGAAGVDEHPRPFLSLALTRVRPVTASDGDRLFAATMVFRLVTDVTTSDTLAALLDAPAAVEDAFDALVDDGLLEGAEGFDEREWSFEYPRATAGARVAVAIATQTFVVRVQRAFNRTPAP